MDNDRNILKYMAIFFLFSFLGWIFEVIMTLIINNVSFLNFLDWHMTQLTIGSLTIPFIFNYGFAALALSLLSLLTDKFGWNIGIKALVDGITLTFFEFLMGLILLSFNIRFWDYSTHPLNILGLSSIFSLTFWILFGLAFELFEMTYEKHM